VGGAARRRWRACATRTPGVSQRRHRRALLRWGVSSARPLRTCWLQAPARAPDQGGLLARCAARQLHAWRSSPCARRPRISRLPRPALPRQTPQRAARLRCCASRATGACAPPCRPAASWGRPWAPCWTGSGPPVSSLPSSPAAGGLAGGLRHAPAAAAGLLLAAPPPAANSSCRSHPPLPCPVLQAALCSL
jgi:hypothetical protein